VPLRATLRTLLRGGRLRPTVARDETVVFFPTYAYRNDASAGCWTIPIHGWVYERDEPSLLQRMALKLIRHGLRLDLHSADPDYALYARRMGAFLVDNEPGKTIRVRLGTAEFTLTKSRGDGHFTGVLTVPEPELAGLIETAERPWMRFAAVLPAGDERDFGGHVALLEPEGLSVISDIDDTIKVTEAYDRRNLLKNTFLGAYQVVPRMAALYECWTRAHAAAVHYVSASPWQLYPFLATFLEQEGFPRGTWHMKQFQILGRGIAKVFSRPRAVKTRPIVQLLQAYPRRRFVLVGDSGQQDADIFGDIARRFRRQITAVCIRNVTGEARTSARFRASFAGLPARLWHVFDDPGEVEGVIAESVAEQNV
jgi:phosphatidate phosphatase APP1